MREMLQELFSDFARPSDGDLSEELKSGLIASFETVINRGLSRQMAIAMVLKWVSEECARLQTDARSS